MDIPTQKAGEGLMVNICIFVQTMVKLGQL